MIKKHGMGWLPDYPDFRDYTEETEEIKTILMRPAKSEHSEARSVVELPLFFRTRI
jgi:hypothetical protein